MRGSTRAGSSALCLIPDRLGTAIMLCPWAFRPLLLLVLASSSSGSIGGPATAAHPPAGAPFPSPSEQTAEGLGGQCTGASLASAALRGEEVKIPIPALRKQLWDVHEAHEPPTVGREAFVLCWIAVCHEIISAGRGASRGRPGPARRSQGAFRTAFLSVLWRSGWRELEAASAQRRAPRRREAFPSRHGGCAASCCSAPSGPAGLRHVVRGGSIAFGAWKAFPRTAAMVGNRWKGRFGAGLFAARSQAGRPARLLCAAVIGVPPSGDAFNRPHTSEVKPH